MQNGARLITNGTDNHLLLIDCVRSWDITGRQAEELFDRIGITLNKNVIADDPRKPLDPSGIRLGTPAVTTRGMKEAEMDRLVGFMLSAWQNATMRRRWTACMKKSRCSVKSTRCRAFS